MTRKLSFPFCHFAILLLCAVVVLSGCASMGKAARNEVKEQILADVANPDCWIGFDVATTIGETESQADRALREAMLATVTLPNENYSRCYKWGLIWKANGEKALGAIKTAIKTGIALAK